MTQFSERGQENQDGRDNKVEENPVGDETSTFRFASFFFLPFLGGRGMGGGCLFVFVFLGGGRWGGGGGGVSLLLSAMSSLQ